MELIFINPSLLAFFPKMRDILAQATSKIYLFLTDKGMENTKAAGRGLLRIPWQLVIDNGIVVFSHLQFDLPTKSTTFFLHILLHDVPIYLPKPGRNALDDLKGSP